MRETLSCVDTGDNAATETRCHLAKAKAKGKPMNDNEVRELLDEVDAAMSVRPHVLNIHRDTYQRWLTTLATALQERLEHRCPHFQPKGEDSGGAYNMQVIIDVTNELLSPDEIPRLSGTRWFQLAIKALIQRIANLRILLYDAELRASSMTRERDHALQQWAKCEESINAIRSTVLEEAAKVADDYDSPDTSMQWTAVTEHIAASIRALKSVEMEDK